MQHIIFYDTETTGLPVFKDPSEREYQPHIVQLAAHMVDIKSRKIIQTMDVIVKPDGWEIPQECIDVHGITNELAMEVGIPEPIAIQMFLGLWDGRLRVAHNTTFDNRIIRIATKRYCTDKIIDYWHAGSYECTGLLSKKYLQDGTQNRYGYKMPKLVEAYKFFFGKEFENSHTAIADVNACMEVYWAIQDHNIEKDMPF